MRKFRFKVFLFVLTIATVYAACRKTDQSADKPLAEGIESRFFSRHASANPLVKAITAFAKKENEKYSFVERMVKQIGYPQWDKAIIISGARSDKISGRSAEDSIELTYIPFVRDSQNYVNATLAVAITPDDTAFKILCDWQYGDTAATGMSKKEFALTIINLNNAVFGNRMFEVQDSTIFEGNPQYLKLNAASNNRHTPLNRLSLVSYTYSYSICWTEWVPLYEGQVVGCLPGPNCPFYTEHEYCIDITWTVGGEGGSGGSGGGGGGSGSGGGWIPSENPNPCGVAARTQLQEGCGPGWVPGGGSGGGSIPPPAATIDSMLTKYSIAVNPKSDSIFTLSMTNHEEWGCILVRNSSNAVYAKNCTTAHNPEYVRQNRTIAAGERIIAELHTHPDTSSNPLERDGPSADDLWGLRNNTRDRYTLFVDCGDERFALVIENTDSAMAFLNRHTLTQLVTVHYSISTSITSPSWVLNWRNATKQSIIQILGRSANSGIGFYISSNTEKTTYIKLNP
jgi:hypothetical protein